MKKNKGKIALGVGALGAAAAAGHYRGYGKRQVGGWPFQGDKDAGDRSFFSAADKGRPLPWQKFNAEEHLEKYKPT